jgi:MscS family membrane protein
MMSRDMKAPSGRRRGRSRALAALLGAVLAAALVAVGPAAGAQPARDAGAGAAQQLPDEEPVPLDSPRGSMAQFLDLCAAGKYDAAARYLDVPRGEGARAPELVRRLKAVLDRHAWIDLEGLSALPGGNADDGLPRGMDQMGRIPAAEASSPPEPVRIVHRSAGGARWVFSRATVSRIDAWYGQLEHRWVLEHLPDPLLRSGPRGLLYWQWLALPALLLASWILGFLLSRLTRRLLARIAARTAATWDDEVLRRVPGPLTLAWMLAAFYVAIPWLGLAQPARELVDRLLRAAFFVAFFWALARSIDVVRQMIAGSPWALQHAASRSLLPLGARVGKVLVVAIGVVALLSELGYPVASLVAGLGIGGLAVALAAQKSLENLFGAFAIGGDQPFREGDVVRVEDVLGTVERVGLRSTRIRTLDRTLITIPNGKLAEMRLESLAARDRMRLSCKVLLVYGTTAHQMRDVLAGLERVLREHPKVWPDAVTVRFTDLGESALHIDVMAWFQTDWDEFQLIRQEMLIQFLAVVERSGTAFAFPTRTLHIETPGGARQP